MHPSSTQRGFTAARNGTYPIRRGKKPNRTSAGTQMMSHHLNLPEYRQIHNDATPISVITATYVEMEMVRMNERIAIPTMNISHPDTPSL